MTVCSSQAPNVLVTSCDQSLLVTKWIAGILKGLKIDKIAIKKHEALLAKATIEITGGLISMKVHTHSQLPSDFGDSCEGRCEMVILFLIGIRYLLGIRYLFVMCYINTYYWVDDYAIEIISKHKNAIYNLEI